MWLHTTRLLQLESRRWLWLLKIKFPPEIVSTSQILQNTSRQGKRHVKSMLRTISRSTRPKSLTSKPHLTSHQTWAALLNLSHQAPFKCQNQKQKYLNRFNTWTSTSNTSDRSLHLHSPTQPLTPQSPKRLLSRSSSLRRKPRPELITKIECLHPPVPTRPKKLTVLCLEELTSMFLEMSLKEWAWSCPQLSLTQRLLTLKVPWCQFRERSQQLASWPPNSSAWWRKKIKETKEKLIN